MNSKSIKLKIVIFSFISLVCVLLLTNDVAISSADNNKSADCIASPEVINDLKDQRQKIQDKEKELSLREEELAKKEKSLNEELGKLEEIKKEVLTIQQQLEGKQEEQLSKFVETLEKMSPKATAKVLGSVQENLAVQVMNRISTEKLAKVMNVMPPDKSSRLSELLTLGRSESRMISSETKAKE